MHERELERTHADRETSVDEQAAPGRANASANLVRCESPQASGILMRKGAGGEVAPDAESALATAGADCGHELPGELRGKFEDSLGTDLSSVRVHTGDDSAAAADAVGARAYATGNDIHFGANEYDPHSTGGQELIAHEVAHTVQQRGGGPARQNKLAVSESHDAAEVEADRAASAMVTGAPASVTSASGIVARKPTAQGKPLTANDKARLVNASQLLVKAKGNLDKTTTALQAYSKEAPTALAAIKESFDETVKVYKAQYKRVNDIIKKAKDIYQLQLQVLTAIIDQLSGPLMGELTKITTKTTAAYGLLDAGEKAMIDSMRSASALDALKAFQADASKETAGQSDKPIDAIKDEAKKKGGGATDGEGPSDATDGMEIAFYKSYSSMQGRANKLLPVALGVAKLTGPLSEAATFVKVMSEDEKSRPDKSPQDVETDAANVWNGSQGIGGAAPSVTAALADLKAAAKQGAATKPKNDMEIQKELWVKWAAGLSPPNTDMLDLDVIEDHLKKIGIWDQLGIETGDWMSDKDEALAVVSAKAQAMVMEHKGAVVEVSNDYSGYTRVKLGDLGTLPARFESATSGKRVKAVVVSASTMGPLDESILAPRDKKTIAEKLISDGQVQVTLRAYEQIEEPTEPPAE